jgi:predicted ATPase
MIQSIEIKNFKSIKEKHFNLKNLNVLLGLNGQGKSSFIQTLLLLAQSSDSLNKDVLLLKGKYVDIGNSQDAFYQFAKNNELDININFSEIGEVNLKFDYTSSSDIFTISEKNKVENILSDKEKEGLFHNGLQYLNADRVEPKSFHQKSYSNVSLDRSIGNRGEYTVHFLETNGSNHIAFDNCLHPKSSFSTSHTNKKLQDKSLIHQVNLWLGEVSPEVNIIIENINSDFVELKYDFPQPNAGKTMPYKPTNVGFGISYALHVVTALLAAQKGDLVIIENPESHIHPKGQAELGKLISLVAQNDVQIIIETHSDHIVNGIRVGVKEEPSLKDKTTLFYFKKIVDEREQYSSIIDIRIDKNGTLSDYPENLLDEWSNQLSKLL